MGEAIVVFNAGSTSFDDTALEKMLYDLARLLGLSGISGDMRVLQESADPRAGAAMQYFVYAMTKYTGAYASVLGGLDAFVFTAGIGEHSAPVRAALCGKLAWLGLKLDETANASAEPRISAPDSRVSVWPSRRAPPGQQTCRSDGADRAPSLPTL
jgi:acetate kinase